MIVSMSSMNWVGPGLLSMSPPKSRIRPIQEGDVLGLVGWALIVIVLIPLMKIKVIVVCCLFQLPSRVARVECVTVVGFVLGLSSFTNRIEQRKCIISTI